jgi:hypothetical protein
LIGRQNKDSIFHVKMKNATVILMTQKHLFFILI